MDEIHILDMENECFQESNFANKIATLKIPPRETTRFKKSFNLSFWGMRS
jgi:hypothetical protein